MSAPSRTVFDTVVTRRLSPDLLMQPGEGCADCFVGEPHVCPNLTWAHLVVTTDEYGVSTAEVRASDRSSETQ